MRDRKWIERDSRNEKIYLYIPIFIISCGKFFASKGNRKEHISYNITPNDHTSLLLL